MVLYVRYVFRFCSSEDKNKLYLYYEKSDGRINKKLAVVTLEFSAVCQSYSRHLKKSVG